MLVVAMACFGMATMAQGLSKTQRIKSGSEDIDLSRNAAPVFYDFDRDGLNDLIVGHLRGTFRFYKNIGTKEQPKYNGFTNIQAGGKDIVLPNY